MNCLIYSVIEGLEFDKFDPEPSFNAWWNGLKRSRRPGFMKFGNVDLEDLNQWDFEIDLTTVTAELQDPVNQDIEDDTVK